MFIGLGVRIGLLGSVAFTPAALFTANEPGVWLDPSDLTTLFQDTAGTQPVTTAGQTMALALDKSKGLVLGPELVTNGDFSSATGWTLQAGWSISGGTLNGNVAPAAFTNAFASVSLVAGRTYQVTYTITSLTSGSVRVAFFSGTGVFGAVRSAVGTYTEFLVAASGNLSAGLQGQGAGFVGIIDNISVRELPGNHATQSTLASRPTYALHPSSGIRNVANGSADVGNAAYWLATTTTNGVTVARVTQGIDTDGLPFADYSVSGTASADTTSGAYLNSMSRVAATSGQTFTSSFIARVISGTPPPADNGVRADVIGETAPTTFIEATTSTVVAPTVDTVITASRTLNNASTNQARGVASIITRPGVTVNYTIRIKAIQFELGSARTAYQFNYANFNIVEAPFAQVGNLLFDGVDDFLVTPTITPGTDKVQVFAGVRKQSDAARGMVAELGNATAGAFRLEAPNSTGVGNYLFTSGGSLAGAGIAAVNGFAAPDTGVLTGVGDIAADVAILRRNGSQVASSTADQGTGNYSAAPIYIGRRGGTTLPFNGRLYGLVVRFGPNLDAATIAATESWLNTKTGAY